MDQESQGMTTLHLQPLHSILDAALIFGPSMRPQAAPAPTAPEELPESPLLPLIQRHAGWLAGLLRLRYGRDAAEDLVQETWLRAAQHDPAKPIRHPRAWLLRIAMNAARDQHRRRQARPNLLDPAGPAALEQLPAAADQAEALLLKQVVLALPAPLRETFLLSRVAGLTYEEIAEHQGVSRKTVEWRMTKALALCAERLRA
jgi:RNA polymerase sigma-70 factor (ECF subfamily)